MRNISEYFSLLWSNFIENSLFWLIFRVNQNGKTRFFQKHFVFKHFPLVPQGRFFRLGKIFEKKIGKIWLCHFDWLRKLTRKMDFQKKWLHRRLKYPKMFLMPFYAAICITTVFTTKFIGSDVRTNIRSNLLICSIHHPVCTL